VDQPDGDVGHRRVQALAGRPGAAQGGRANQRCGGHQLLSTPHPTSPRPGQSVL
jgi:hypothetical protein